MSRQNSDQLYLSPDQQDLLMAALNSNQPNSTKRSVSSTSQKQSGSTSMAKVMNGDSDLFGSPVGSAPGSGQLDYDPDDSPYLDFDIDGDGDDGFNFDEEGQMIGDIPGEDNGGHDLHEKRKSIPDDEEDDEGGGKRREGEDKSSKKPGRKPLTSEPTTKRKAQNRAAQRAFRERKEKHLKDLETKVEDLEKASESSSYENGLLKAKVERLQVELKEYRKRLSWVSKNPSGRTPQLGSGGFGAQPRNNNYSNDFQFEFPKFGDLPTNNVFDSKQLNTNQNRSSTMPNVSNRAIPGVVARSSMSSVSPQSQATMFNSNSNSPMGPSFSPSPVNQTRQNRSVDNLSGLFSPSILEASRNSNAYGYFPQHNTINQNAQASFDQNSRDSVPGFYASSSNTDSPASSSDSHNHVSSIGTSPEPNLNSPGKQMNEHSLNTINEEANLNSTFGGEEASFCDKLSLACGNTLNPVPPIKFMSNGDLSGTAITPGFDLNGINWLAQQNGGTFEPELFGDYRESQDAIVSQDFGAFFNDAFPLPDLGSPEHPYNALAPSPGPQASKVDLMKQVDAIREGDEEVVPGEDRGKMMTCNKIWDRLQSMEKFRNGEIDVDNLCSELRRKAKCSEGGAVLDSKDVDKILESAK